MDSHVATQCRRAKRSKSKLLDLSCLGLPKWNPAIFELVELQTLKINDNSLTEVPPDLSRLEQLTALDVSNNKIEKLPVLDFDKMKNLGSILLDGNPVAETLSSKMLQQLARPDPVSGMSAAELLRSLLVETCEEPAKSLTGGLPLNSSELAGPAGSVGRAKPVVQAQGDTRPSGGKTSLQDYMKSLGGSDEEYSDDFASDDDVPKPPRQVAGGQSLTGKQEPVTRADERMAAPGKLVPRATHWDGSDSDDVKPPRKAADTAPPKRDALTSSSKGATSGSRRTNDGSSRDVMSNKDLINGEAEVARLQAQVKELKAQLALNSRPPESNSKISLASTLPSRLHALDENDGADKLKAQLQEEQRRAKRLERDNQKLQDRLRESSTSGGTSAPHVELAEIQEGEILSKSGGFSIIYMGTWHGTPVAIKKLFDPSNSRENLAEMDNEVDKLGKLRHPNILSLLAVHRKPPVYSIILEIITGGSLFQLLHSKHSFNFAAGTATPVPTQELLTINESMALALAFMHARNIVHRDVKSHNVLLSPHLEAKLCDFGLARMKSELMTGAMQFAGTPQYMAPELLRQQKYTERVDVWAFGVLLWESVAQDIPFANLEVPEIRELVTTGKMIPMPNTAPRPIQGIIKSCWTIDYTCRPAMSDVLAQVRNFLG